MSASTGSLTGLSAVKLALMAREARAQLGAIARAEPIAIIGMGCRFPGGADSPETFWAVLRDAVDAVGDIPAARWDVAGMHDPDPAVPGKIAANAGGFIDGVDQFDAAFFGIMRREAERMDPQHRVFLEVAIEALDRAGLSRDTLAGSDTGVFVASYYNDYAMLQLADREAIDGRTLTGTQHSVLANRLSYLLDLRGPSISIDTACSSSLVAVHLACQSLRTAETSTALAGGVSLMLAPEMMIALSKVGFMSASGRCRTFDALADGFIRGEGCGVVVLKRLSDAIADGDRILSVIRGTAVNQDGHSTVLAAPNGLAQQALVREALANAQLTPERVGFVETHGTATPLGDPIEVEALAATIGAPRSDGSVCYLGSAKANLGHMEAAAGVAGLIKATLVLEHGEIPAQVHFTSLNPHLSLDGTCLAVADAHREWPAGAFPRVAGVSGFGVGGTNAHVLLEEAPAYVAETPTHSGDVHLLPLSAQTPAALVAVIDKWIPYLESGAATVDVICGTAGARRSHYEHRVALTGRTSAAMAAQLRAFAAGEHSSVLRGQRPQHGTPSLAFVFSGQGSQWVGMGRELAEREPVFRDVLLDLDARFRTLGDWSLLAMLDEPQETSRLMHTEVAQPAIFAIQVALAALWDSWGVRPDAVVGHSIGELAALYVAGVLTLDEAVRIVFHRGRILQRATGNGQMAAVSLSEDDAARLVAEIGPELSVAAINGPNSTVLSGAPDALERALAQLTSRDVQRRMLPVSYAFHSAQMAPLERELVATLGTITTQPARIAVYSTVTGARLHASQVDAAYFGRNVRATVRFALAIDAMLEHVDAFVEVAPHPVLSTALAECISARHRDVPIAASMRRGRPERESMLQACAAVYALGITPRWERVMPLLDVPVDLPSYPWQRERYWLRAIDSSKWLADHRIAQRIVMPGAAMLAALHAAAVREGEREAIRLSDFVVHDRLMLDEGAVTAMWRTQVRREKDGLRLELHADSDQQSLDGAASRIIASARAVVGYDQLATAAVVTEPDGRWLHDCAQLYDRFAALGVDFGPAFRTIERWRLGTDMAEAWLVRHADAVSGVDANGVHPTVLDGALQLAAMALTTTDGQFPGALVLPLGVESYRVIRPVPDGVRALLRIERTPGSDAAMAHVQLLDANGAVVAVVEGVRFAPVTASALASFEQADRDLYTIEWRRVARAEPIVMNAAAGRWIVLTDGGEFGIAVLEGLRAAGGDVRQIQAGMSTAPSDSGWIVRPEDQEGLGRALLALHDGEQQALRGIVHAWSADSPCSGPETPHADWLMVGAALAVVQVMTSAAMTPPLWLVTQASQAVDGAVVNASHAGLWGLANVIAVEHTELACRVVDVGSGAATMQAASLIRELVRESDVHTRIALRGDERLIPMMARYRSERAAAHAVPRDARLLRAESGALDELRWVSTPANAPGRGELRLCVEIAGVNFRDVLLSLGMYPGSNGVLGAECVGVIEAVGKDVTDFAVGDRVFGFTPGSMASTVVVPAAYVTRLPSRLSAEQAAAVPVAFLTAMLGLYDIANIVAGSHVLIHAAAGGVGVAAVQLAQRRGAIVYATAGSPTKREYLRSIGVQHVYDSRSLAFADDVLRATRGRGVDVVLNSLAGDFIEASVRTLTTGGCMLELGKRDVWTPERMARIRPDVDYHVYDLGVAAAHAPGMVRPMLDQVVSWFDDGTLRPLPTRCFRFAEVTSAFRFMAQARHIGKLVLRAPQSATAKHAPIVQPNGTYLITGGTGALGVRTGRWLVESGARSLVLTSRRTPDADTLQSIASMRASGASVHVRLVDAGDADAMGELFRDLADTMPPLRGVVHAAGVADDGVLLNYSWERVQSVLHGKARGARILDRLTERLSLDFFVLYSSVGVHLGPLGQGAYAAANAELDALASSRRGRGLPALSVAWGQWPENGMAAALRARGSDVWTSRGLGWIDPARAFVQLERLLRDEATYAAFMPMQWDQFLSRVPVGLDPAFFSAMVRVPPVATPSASRSIDDAPTGSVVEQWRRAPSSTWAAIMLAHVVRNTRHVMGVDESVPIGAHTALKDVGLDSLMAVELRNVLTRSLGKSLPATLLFDYPTLDSLVGYLLRTFGLLAAADAPAVAAEGASAATANAAVPSAATPSAAVPSAATANATLVDEATAQSRDTRARFAALEARHDEPIAIVGLSIRAPGGVRDAESFGRLLWSATDAVSDIPATRWPLDAWFDEAQDAAGKMYTKFGGFIKDVDQFDAEFFGIAPVEAASMDPQQRLVLELAWHALEDAGHAPSALAGTRTGVYLGISNSDYGRGIFANPELIDPYFSSGTALSVAAGRVSYVLGLEGPAISVDTACSSSLVALHLACQALRLGECELALAGGVNLILTPELHVNFSKAGMMSRDGRCRTFDAHASGYVRGEGGGLVVMRRLRDALADGDRVLAVVRGSAVNQDGRSNGLTAPNGPSQESVIRQALAQAGVDGARVGYVEAHGTGTSLGDPIEVNALSAVLGDGRAVQTPLNIGSVKTNIGHLEAAAGIVGIIKTVIALQREELPPNLHFETPNPLIDWTATPMQVPTMVMPWAPIDGRRIAGVSSFGFSGTNAHVILEGAPDIARVRAPEPAPSLPVPRELVLAISARDATALRELATAYAEQLRSIDATSLADFCFTANTGRAPLAQRVSVSGATPSALASALDVWLHGASHPRVVAGTAGADSPRVALLFPGQGPQYIGMGQELYETNSVFRKAFDACADALDALLPHPIRAIVFATDRDATLLNQTAYAQPAMFAIEYALAALWMSWGIVPTAVMGHSFGEYAAACLAGVVSLNDAATMVVARGRLVAALPDGGLMTVVEASEAELLEAVRLQGGPVAIAAVNGPSNCVLSGERQHVCAIADRFAALGRRVKPLRVSHAFHSPLVDPILDDFEQALVAVRYVAPTIPLISNLTAQVADLHTVGRARYWRDHLRHPVRFAESVHALASQRVTHFVEVSPHPVLLGMAADCIAGGAWLPSLRQHQGAWSEMLLTLQRLYVDGANVNWRGVSGAGAHRRQALPLYPFQRKRHWIDAMGVRSVTLASSATVLDTWSALTPVLTEQALRGPLDLDAASYPAKWECLARLTRALVYETLQELGVFTQMGESQTLDTIMATTGIRLTHRHLVARWLQHLVHDNTLRQTGNEFSNELLTDFRNQLQMEFRSESGSRHGSSRPALASLWAEAEQRFYDNREMLAYVRNCATRLSAIVTGRESSLESLFPGGSFELATALYEQSATMRYINGLAAAALDAFRRTLPAGRVLRVLEVGAGTGGTTSSMLRVLPGEGTTYRFTDVSDAFLDHARVRFAEYPQLEFGRFDLELPIEEQGCVRGQFDVIVSANCVHASRDVRVALLRLRELLAPNGVLILVESTVHFEFFDITTGLIEGWQVFSDDLRTNNPLLAADQWTTALKDAGFTAAAAWPERDALAESMGQHVIVAHVAGTIGELPDAPAASTDRPTHSGHVAIANHSLRTQLVAALPIERHALLCDGVRAEVMRILRLDPDALPARHDRLMDLGMDSLMAVQLRNALVTMLDVEPSLPATLIFDYPTIDAISSFLLERVGLYVDTLPGSASPSAARASAHASEPLAASTIASMSDDEIAAALMAREIET